MKKRVVALLLAAAMTAGMTACGGSASGNAGSEAAASAAEAGSEAEEAAEEAAVESEEAADSTAADSTAAESTAAESTAAAADASGIAGGQDAPEVNHIKWAQGLSGNILVTIAKDQGYFDEVGLEVEEIPLDPGGLEGVVQGNVDIASNFGTNGPLQMIGNGDDMAIIGGFMMEGAMAIIGKEGCEWDGIKSFKGKTVAGSVTSYATSAGLIREGIDPNKDVKWMEFDNEGDGVSAVLNGECDYAIIGTGWMYQTKNTEGIQILNWTDEITPEYSCCRMVARKSWVDENPNTVKLLDEALLRAQLYFEAHREDCIKLMADYLKADYEYVEAYMGEEEHYEINVDPLYNSVMEQWQFQKDYNFIDPNTDDSVIENAIYPDIYKAALDFCVENYYDDNPEFWDSQVELFERQTA